MALRNLLIFFVDLNFYYFAFYTFFSVSSFSDIFLALGWRVIIFYSFFFLSLNTNIFLFFDFSLFLSPFMTVFRSENIFLSPMLLFSFPYIYWLPLFDLLDVSTWKDFRLKFFGDMNLFIYGFCLEVFDLGLIFFFDWFCFWDNFCLDLLTLSILLFPDLEDFYFSND